MNYSPFTQSFNKLFFTLLLGLLLSFGVHSTEAASVINYQGTLKSSSQTTVPDTSYTFTFKLYTVSTGGSAVWTETQLLSTQQGLFSAQLGSVTPFSSTLFSSNPSLYLGITINSDSEMTPRQRVGSSPYAFTADEIALSGIRAAAQTNTVNNLNFAQNWNWNTLTTEDALSISSATQTTGTLLNVTTNSNSLNSTKGIFSVINSGTSTNGVIARIQSNGTDANSGLTVLANGNVGVGTNTPSRGLEVKEQIYARNVADGDLSGTIFGKEYLYAFQKKMIDGGTPVVVLAGDSTVSGDAISDSNYLLQNLLKKIIIQSYNNVTIYNDAVSGTNTDQWLSTYLPAQIARNPDLMIIRYGVNDGANNRAGFKSDLRAGLALIRASRGVATTACVLMTPSSTNDSPNGRDAAWYKQINPIIREAARDYQCTFIDTYATFYDSANGAAWYDNPYGDGRHIHPKDALNLQIGGLIAETILPKTLSSVVGTTTFENPSSSFRTALNADLVSTYSKGLSFYRSGSGFPYDGQVINFRQSDGVWLQLNNSYTGPGLAWRTGRTTGFNAWEYPITADANRNITGNIGLGITPAEKLHLSASSPVIRLDDTNGTTPAFLTNHGGGSTTLGVNRQPITGTHSDVTKTSAALTITATTTESKFMFYTATTPNSLGGGNLRYTITGAGDWQMNTSGRSLTDTNGNILLGTSHTGSAVNYLSVANSVTGSGPSLSALGSDTDINIRLTPKGAGNVGITSGRLGVGTVSPGAKLEVIGSSGSIFIDNNQIAANRNPLAGSVADGTKGSSVMVLNTSTSGGNIQFWTNASAGGNITERMRIAEDGKVGIGNTGPSYLLQVGSSTPVGIVARFQNSTGTCDINPTNTALSCSSDETLKENIISISESSLDKIKQLNPVSYSWKNDENHTTQTGFIAQSVRTIFPNLVSEDKDTHLLSLNYMGFIPYIIKAIQEFDTKLAALSELVNTKKVVTQELCVGSTCITEDQFMRMIQQGGAQPTQTPVIPEPASEEEEIETPEPTSEEEPQVAKETSQDTQEEPSQETTDEQTETNPSAEEQNSTN